MLSSRFVIHFAVVCFVNPNYGLKRSRDISATDTIRHVVNDIFANLRIKVNDNIKIKKYSTIHKHFVKLTRHENDNWIEILKSSRVDGTINNGSADFTSVINEVLNDENKIDGVSDILNKDSAKKSVENFLDTLTKLKENYLLNNSYSTENDKVLQLFYENRYNTAINETFASENSTHESDVWEPKDARRIFHGKESNIKNYPFVVSVHIFNQFTCAGSIIHADLVITAASCLQLAHNNRFYRESSLFLTVRVGSSFFDNSGEVIPVLEIYFHPSYQAETLHNLAIMRLHRRIRFRKKHRNVKRIDIDTNEWALPPNTAGITVVGWGPKTVSGKFKNPWSKKLSQSVLDFYPLWECQKIYSKEHVTEKNFCAGFIVQGGGACNRDVGAPGVVHGVLTGVVSFGSTNCGSAGSPTVFTKLGFYADWIESIMEQIPASYNAKTTPYTRTTESMPMSIDNNFLIPPIIRSPIELSLGLDTQIKEFLKMKGLEPAYHAQQTSVQEQAYDDRLRNKKTETTDLQRYTEKSRDGSGSSTENHQAPFNSFVSNMANVDVEEQSSRETYVKEYANKNEKSIVATPNHKKEKNNVNDDENTSKETDGQLDTKLPLKTEEQVISSNNLKVVLNMLPRKPVNRIPAHELISAQKKSVSEQQSSEGSKPKKQHSFEGFESETQHSSEGYEPKKQHSSEGYEPKKQHGSEGYELMKQHSSEGYEPKKQHSSEGYEPKKQHSYESYGPKKQQNFKYHELKRQLSPEGFKSNKQYKYEGTKPKKQHSFEGLEPKPHKSFKRPEPIKQHSSGGFAPEKQHDSGSFAPKKQQTFESFEEKNQLIRSPQKNFGQIKIDGPGLVAQSAVSSKDQQLDDQIDQLVENFTVNKNSRVINTFQDTDVDFDTKIKESSEHKKQEQKLTTNFDILSLLYFSSNNEKT